MTTDKQSRANGHSRLLTIVSRGIADLGLVTAEESIASVNHEHAADVVMRGARLQAVANWLLSKDNEQLDGLRRLLCQNIKQSNPSGAGSDQQREARMNKLFLVTDKLIEETFATMSRDALAHAEQLANGLHEVNAKRLKERFDVEADKPADAKTTLVMGAPLGEHYDYLANQLAFKFRTAVRTGVEQDETAEQICSRLDGGNPASPVEASEPVKAAEPTPAQAQKVDKSLTVGVRIFDGTENSIQKVIEAAVNALANEADASAVGDDPDTETNLGWQWVAVMDASTCPACEYYDGMVWDSDFEPANDDTDEYPGDPGLHFGCRCSRLPVNLDEPSPKDVSLSDYLGQFTKEEKEQAFGTKLYESWTKGTVSDAALTGQKSAMMSLQDFLKAEAA